MKRLPSIILHSSFFILHSLFAAVPMRWTVETSRLQPVQFDAVHGETLALEAAFNSYGTPLQLPSNAALFYQTNGMGAAWWSVPATVTSNRISAVFAPTNDPGAPVVSGFLGSTGEIYRAAFTLRFRHGPGATPNVIEPPVRTLDFATITVLNPPWSGGTGGVDTNAVRALIESAGHLATTGGVMTGSIVMRGSGGVATTDDVTISTNGVSGWKQFDSTDDVSVYQPFSFDWRDLLTSESDPTVPSWAKAATPPEGMTANAAVLTNGYLKTKSGASITAANISGAQTATDVSTAINAATNAVLAAADDAYYPKAQGDAWSTYWDGDDVRVTVTNYDSSANIPSLYLEQRTNETALATNLFKTVWREMAHWEKFLGTNWNWNSSWSGFSSWSESLEDELTNKADRAWGFYDSHTGEYAPDGYTQISSEHIIIAKGMGYQKTVTTDAEVWVLTANEPYEPTGVSTNGGFQIRDGDGNVQFEIIKGDKVTVAAQANAVTVDTTTTPNTLVVTYNIVAATHPTCEVCLSLTNAAWKAETDADCAATVSWSGSSGAYVARIQPNAATTSCFAKATYQRGGDTYINNRCAVGMSQIVLGGVTYNLGTNTISGSTVLTLTPAN